MCRNRGRITKKNSSKRFSIPSEKSLVSVSELSGTEDENVSSTKNNNVKVKLMIICKQLLSF